MSRRLVLCDDEIHILRAAEIKLVRSGFQVRCAPDGQAAWELIEQDPPDMLVTDYQMPRLNGLQLIERLRSNSATRDLPVIMLTAKGFELSHAAVHQNLGVLRILGKPFSPRELVLLVNETIGSDAAVPQEAALATAL